MDSDNRRKILTLVDEMETLTITSNIQTFLEPNGLIDHIYRNCKTVETFDVYVSGRYIDKIKQSAVSTLAQVKRITFCFESTAEMKQAKQGFGQAMSNFFFCLKSEIPKRIENNGFFLDSIYEFPATEKVLKSSLETRRSQVQQKQKDSESCRHHHFGEHISMSKEDSTMFPKCQEATGKEVISERGFTHDMERLSISSSSCECSADSEFSTDHINQCQICDETFNSLTHLTKHQMTCSPKTGHCLMEDYCLTEGGLYAVPEAMNGILDCKLRTKDVHDRQLLEQVYTCIMESNRAFYKLRIHDEEHATTRRLEHGLAIMSILKNLRAATQQLIDSIFKLTDSISKLNDLILKSIVSNYMEILNITLASSSRVYIWKITSVSRKTDALRSQDRRFIWSDPFYSSINGYKFRIGLFIFNDDSATPTHLSLSLALLRGEYDATLQWPFKYKIVFCLYGQNGAQENIIHFIDPGTELSCFQRPNSKICIPSCISKFCPLEALTKENSCYVQNDTMFIKVFIDHLQISGDLWPYVLNLNPGIPTNQQLALIKAKLDRLRSRPENALLKEEN